MRVSEEKQRKKDKEDNKIIDKAVFVSFFAEKSSNVKISGGLYHSMYINQTKGKCYTFGSNAHGAVGKSDQRDIVSTPYLHENKFIIDGDAGCSHCLYVDKDNKVYLTGSVHNKRCHEMTLISRKEIGMKGNQIVVRVIAGRNFDVIIVADHDE